MVDWRPVPGFDRYHASACGRVRGPGHRGRGESELKPWEVESTRDRRKIYLKVGLYRDGKRVRIYLHRLICLTFHGPAPEGCTDVLHMDHDPFNCRADNLCWGTHSENIRQTYSDVARERRCRQLEREAMRDELELTPVAAGDDIPF
jgi:HNH endonuclease